MSRIGLASLAVVALAGCGGSSSTGGGTTGGYTITISGLRFSPLALAVNPGATVTVINTDAMPHSVTSEATSGSYTPGGVAGVSFDTGVFGTGQRTFTVPASAPEGTVVPYYCRNHLAAMGTPNGTLRITASATPPTPTPGTGGGGGY